MRSGVNKPVLPVGNQRRPTGAGTWHGPATRCPALLAGALLGLGWLDDRVLKLLIPERLRWRAPRLGRGRADAPVIENLLEVRAGDPDSPSDPDRGNLAPVDQFLTVCGFSLRVAATSATVRYSSPDELMLATLSGG